MGLSSFSSASRSGGKLFHIQQFQRDFQSAGVDLGQADLHALPQTIGEVADRAAQFAPFAALTRHGEAVKETSRLTESRIEIDESWKKVLDEKLQSLRKRCDEKPDVSATYFVPDTKKQGGAYVTVSGSLKKIDAYRRVLVLTDKTEVPIDEIIEIDSTVC